MFFFSGFLIFMKVVFLRFTRRSMESAFRMNYLGTKFKSRDLKMRLKMGQFQPNSE